MITLPLVTCSSMSTMTLPFGPMYSSTSMITRKVQVQLLRVRSTIASSLPGSSFYRLKLPLQFLVEQGIFLWLILDLLIKLKILLVLV